MFICVKSSHTTDCPKNLNRTRKKAFRCAVSWTVLQWGEFKSTVKEQGRTLLVSVDVSVNDLLLCHMSVQSSYVVQVCLSFAAMISGLG